MPCICAAWLHQFRREGQPTQERAEAAIALATEQGFPHLVGVGHDPAGLGAGRAGPGRGGDGPDAPGPGRLAGHGGRAATAVLSGPAGRGLWAGGAGRGRAAPCWPRRWRWCNDTGERCWEAELYRLKGELLLAQLCGAARRGGNLFSPGPRHRPPPAGEVLELRAAMSLSRLWQQQGKRAEAHELLAPIYGWFTEGFDTADLQEAKALLEELAG